MAFKKKDVTESAPDVTQVTPEVIETLPIKDTVVYDTLNGNAVVLVSSRESRSLRYKPV
jgi:hypothetical protein